MTIIFPETVKAQGNKSVVAAQTIVDPDAPKLTEVNHATSVNVSCFLYGNFSATGTTSKGEAPKKLCTTKGRQQFGTTTYDISDIQYSYDPQADDDDDANAAKVALVEGTEVYLIERLGLSAENTAYAVGQKVRVHHVRLGPQNKTETGDGEFDEFSITQSVVYVTSEGPVEEAVIVA